MLPSLGQPLPEDAKTLRFGVPNCIDLKIWKRLDPHTNRLTRLKVEKARKKYRREVEDETRQIHFDNRGNANSMAIPNAILRMQLKKADEFAEQQYSIFRDVWLKLGGVESAVFIRTISWMAIQPPFDARGSSFANEEKRRFRRSGGLHPRVSPETIRKGFDSLKTEWRDKLEIKALEWEAEALGKASTVALHNSSGEIIPRTHERPAGIRHEFERKLLPGGTIYGVGPDSNEYVAWDGEQYMVYQTKERVFADDSLIPIGSVQELRVDHPHPGPMGQVEVVIPKPKEQKDKPQSTLGRRRQRGSIDAKKELIALLKGRIPNAKARRICELIDQRIDSIPALKFVLAPLQSWKKKAPGERTWGGLYDNDETRNLVRSYVNKVPALQTSARSSK